MCIRDRGEFGIYAVLDLAISEKNIVLRGSRLRKFKDVFAREWCSYEWSLWFDFFSFHRSSSVAVARLLFKVIFFCWRIWALVDRFQIDFRDWYLVRISYNESSCYFVPCYVRNGGTSVWSVTVYRLPIRLPAKSALTLSLIHI